MLNTPFRVDDSIDAEGLRSHVVYALDAGVAGFLVNGLAAEVEYLTAAERADVLRHVADEAGPTPVIAGLGSATGADIVRIAKHYLDLGCAGLMVNGAGVEDDTLTRVLRDLDALKPEMLMLQDWDADGVGKPVDTLLGYVDRFPSLHWLKIEVNPAGPKYSELIARGPAHLCVAGGWAVREMMDGLERGVHVFMPTALHRTYCRIHALFAEGRRDESRALFERVRPILDFSNQRLDLSIVFFKRLLHAQGVYSTPDCRLPTAMIDPGDEALASAMIILGMALESETDPV